MKAEELYDKYRQWDDPIWLSLSHRSRERWHDVARAVNKVIDTTDANAYIRGYDAGYEEGYCAEEYGD